MNFIEEYNKGQAGMNKGIPMGEGLSTVSKAIDDIQKGMLIGIAAAPKVGKSTMVDNGMVIQPYLYAKQHGLDLEIPYFSYEIDRISKEFDYCAFFLHHDKGITHAGLPEGVTYLGEKEVEISAKYIRGRLKDDNGQLIKVNAAIEGAVKEVYETRIIELFGEYSSSGLLIKRGMILFIEYRENPTGVRNFLKAYASQHGTFVEEDFRDSKGVKGTKITAYKPHNPHKHVIVVMDHLRKLMPERGFLMKQTVDKMVEYFVEFRNWCGWTIIAIIHLNRAMTDPYRLKMYGDMLYPNGDDVKDTGNFSEECDHLFTMFNPNDERYNLKKHFGKDIRDRNGNELYPKMRTIHLVESRHAHFPQHFRVNMHGNIKKFEKLII